MVKTKHISFFFKFTNGSQLLSHSINQKTNWINNNYCSEQISILQHVLLSSTIKIIYELIKLLDGIS